MLSRFEFLYIEAKKRRLEDVVFEIENNPKGFYSLYQDYKLLEEEKQEEIRREWEEFYEGCRGSYFGEAFWSLYPLLKVNLQVNIKRKAEEVKSSKAPFTPAPSGADPYEIERQVGAYSLLRRKLDTLEKLYEEYKPVYGKRDKKEDDLSG